MAKRQSRTREARQRRQKQRRQNQRLYVLIAIIVVAVVAIAVVIVSNQPVEAFVADDLSARYEDIERSFSSEGYPRLGDADAPVTVQEYASFACAGCAAFHSDSFDAVLERVRDGQVRFSYIPLQTGSVPNAPGASRAALCAGQQEMFWEMHDVLFDWQTRYGNTAFSQNRLLAGVEQLGLSGSAFTNCFNSAAISNTINAAQSEEVSTTPTIRVNGVTLGAGQTIPSADLILQAVDDATPADWGLPAEEPPAEEVETEQEAESEQQDESAEAAATPQADTADATEEVETSESSETGEAPAEAEEEQAEAPAEAESEQAPESEEDPDTDEDETEQSADAEQDSDPSEDDAEQTEG